ncbi:MAG: asparagine synthase (glutamine-hydrolyzing) [Anaerolineales bacterium]
MCGICGWLNPKGVDLQSLVSVNRLAAHRGPDGEGYWLYDGNTPTGEWFGHSEVTENLARMGVLGLGHRRLSIIDLSDDGLQPMPSTSRQQWIVFNGEVYNYLELRSELSQAGYVFQTNSDTEVILAAYHQWGTACFNHFNGMWGLVIVDLEKRKLILSRDRLGIKPLYYWQDSNSFAFVSEIKQLLGLPGFVPTANLNAVVEYIDNGYEIPPETFFQDVKAFPPASFAEVALDSIIEPQARRFWGIDDLLPASQNQSEAGEKLRFLFEDSVRLRMRSDVPVGVCLSGGLDSSLIYGEIQTLRANRNATHAFSASFQDKRFDESPFVELILDKYGGQIHYAFPDAVSFLEDFETFIYQHDEPPGSISQYAAWSVMRLARQNLVPVLLNGQGGDELFSGYWAAYYLYLRHHLLRDPWMVASHLIGAFLPGGNPEMIKEMPPHFRQYLIRKTEANRNVLSDALLAYKPGVPQNWAIQSQKIRPENFRWAEISRIHLPRLLKWDDRNSMAFAIEGRYPFLDYRVVEFAMRLPVEMNFHAGWNKYLLRKSLGHLIPAEIQWRRSKVGFVTPQSTWLQTTLKPVFLDWVQTPSASLCQMIDREKLKTLVRELLSSGPIHPMNEDQHLLFRLFALDAWLNRFKIII